MSVETAVCTVYEKLHEECRGALNNWNEGRVEIYESGRVGRESDDKLLQLQAKFAKASWVMRNHQQICELCQMISTIGERHSEEDSRSYRDHRHWA